MSVFVINNDQPVDVNQVIVRGPKGHANTTEESWMKKKNFTYFPSISKKYVVETKETETLAEPPARKVKENAKQKTEIRDPRVDLREGL